MTKTKNIYLKVLVFTIIFIVILCTKVFADDSKYVKNIKYEHVGEGLSITWDKVENATGYTVYIKGENDEEYKELNDKKITDNKTIITNVDPSVKYSIKILAYTEVETTLSNGKKKTTEDYYDIKLDDENVVETKIDLQEKTKEIKIENLKYEIGEITKVVYQNDSDTDSIWRKVTLTWKGITGIDGYEVFIKSPFSQSIFKYESATNSYSMDLPNHDESTEYKEGATYEVAVGAYKIENNEKKYIAYSDKVTFSIKDKKYIGTPELYDIKVEGENAVLRWKPVDNVDGYEVHLSIINVPGKDEDIKLKPEDAKDGYVAYTIGLKNYKYGFKAKVRAFRKSEENKEKRNYGDYSNERILEVEKIFTDSGITFNASEWGNATRIVNNWDGVNIYEHADTSSKVLATIGYATEVTVTAKEATYGPTHKDKDGTDLWWVKVKLDTIEGFMNAQRLTPEEPEKIGNYRFFIGLGNPKMRYYDKLSIYTEPNDKTLKETKTSAGSVKVIGKAVTTTLTPGEWAVIEYADGKDGRAFVHSKELGANFAVSIGGTSYATLQNAIDAVPTDNTETTIKLLKDISDNVTIASGKNIKLDLNNHKITNAEQKDIIVVEEGATLTIASDGEINIEYHNDIEEKKYKNWFGAIRNNGILLINDGKINASGKYCCCIWNIGTTTINGGEFNSNSLYEIEVFSILNGGGKVTINNGKYTSNDIIIENTEGFEQTLGEMNIISGEFIATGNKTNALHNRGIMTIYGGKILAEGERM